MIYCVVPPELAEELFDKLTEHYAGDPNVTVIVDQRKRERRDRGAKAPEEQRRMVRDRRRRRVTGDLPPLTGGE
ncbi:MAG TPA: hypothetical protein VG165_11855 [Solirubrobacteraceae bacterium]|jgi:hypothetical protein|nr:hypothetical protein [Solirubrobacteraceae bacterium]